MNFKKIFWSLAFGCASLFSLCVSAEIVPNANLIGFCHDNEMFTANATVTLNGASGNAVPAQVTIRRCYTNPFDYSQYIANLDVSGGGVFHNGLGPLAGTGVFFNNGVAGRSYFKTYNFAANPAITVKWYDAAGINALQSGTSFYAVNSNNQEFTLTIH